MQLVEAFGLVGEAWKFQGAGHIPQNLHIKSHGSIIIRIIDFFPKFIMILASGGRSPFSWIKAIRHSPKVEAHFS